MKSFNAFIINGLLKLTFLLLCFSLITPSGHTQEWIQMDGTITGSSTSDMLGYWIVMSDDGYTIAAGAPGNDAVVEDGGAARVFEWNGTAWIQKGSDILGLAVDDELGYSVSLNSDGSILAVGATEDTDEQTKNGFAKVFEWDGSDWMQLGSTIHGSNPYDRFGTSVSLDADGQHLAVGSRNGPNGEDSGNVKVFEWDGSNWVLMGSAINGTFEGESCGWALDLNNAGNILAVGFPGDGVTTNGIARIYEYDAGDWHQIGPDLLGDAPAARFGWVISLNATGDIVGVGSRDFDGSYTDQGQVKVYSRNGNDWDLMGNPVSGQEEYEFFGWSLDLNNEGMSFIAGVTPFIDNTWDEGHGRIYEFDGSDWIMKGEEINGENEGDRAGFSVAMNGDGNRVCLGAPFATVSGWGEGKIMIFEYGYVDIQENDFGETFSVYPNPFVDHFKIKLGKSFNHITVDLYNVKGQLLAQKEYQQSSEISFTWKLSEGIYFVEVKSDEGHTANLKLMKGK